MADLFLPVKVLRQSMLRHAPLDRLAKRQFGAPVQGSFMSCGLKPGLAGAVGQFCVSRFRVRLGLLKWLYIHG